ncbi:hypothetical protein NQZ68_002863, partial [Dissostichus eleginoides]
DCKKAQLVDIAGHYKIAVVGSKRKDEIKAVIVSSLFEQGVLQKSEFGVAGVVPRSVLGVIGDVEKMVAIPAVVQSFHQAPPVDLQVRGDPRAPEWANVIIAEERVIGRISVRCWNLRGRLLSDGSASREEAVLKAGQDSCLLLEEAGT